MDDRIINMILEQNELTWQNIIYDLIKSDEMDPWDIDVSLLTQRYIETIKAMEQMNFLISGKVLLAAALLVKIKSDRLVEQDIAYFDSILFPQTEALDDMEMQFTERQKVEHPPLGIRTPLPRKRKVSVQDLMKALQRALEVDKRRTLKYNRYYTENVAVVPERKVDILVLIKSLYGKIVGFFEKKETITFTKLLPEGEPTKREKVLTLLPLLHLENESKVDLSQEANFAEIYVTLNNIENTTASIPSSSAAN
ncbi:MAG TPA: segregation/condensation protein A [Nanoarchaeota archaeon]|nr:segregation/condensation protein A [Nanoarchaeota archaeon]